MKRIQTGSIHEMHFRESNGCLGVFGLPFLIGGICVLAGGVSAILNVPGPAKYAGAGTAALIGLVHTTVGAVFVFGRSGIILDRRSNRVTQWWGLLVPMSKTPHDWRKYTEIRVAIETRRTKRSTYSVYAVSLTGEKEKPLLLIDPQDQLEARQFAESVARFTRLPLRETTGAEEVLRTPGLLDESLRKRAARTGELAEISAPPEQLKSTYSVEGNRAVFVFRPATLIAGLLVAVIVGGFIMLTVNLTAGLVAGALLAVVIILTQTTELTIEASPKGLKIKDKCVLWTREIEIPAEELEDLQVDHTGQSLVAVSDKRIESFGEGLPHGELDWIRRVLLRAVTA